MKDETVFRSEEGRQAIAAFERSILGAWPFPFVQTTVQSPYGPTFVVTAGNPNNPALVLLHGAASNVLGWGGAIPHYLEDFYVIAPDVPGDPGLSNPVRLSWTEGEHAQWLSGVLDGLGVDRASLLGLSFGAWIAAQFAAAQPARVVQLALLSPGGIVPARFSAILKTIRYSLQGPRGAERMKRMVFGPGEPHPLVSQFFDLVQRHYNPRFGSPPLLTDGELAALRCPVLVQAGGEDAFFDGAKCEQRIRKHLPQAIILEGGDQQHGVTEYAGDIRNFLLQHAHSKIS